MAPATKTKPEATLEEQRTAATDAATKVWRQLARDAADGKPTNLAEVEKAGQTLRLSDPVAAMQGDVETLQRCDAWERDVAAYRMELEARSATAEADQLALSDALQLVQTLRNRLETYPIAHAMGWPQGNLNRVRALHTRLFG
jgi:hypothetical protein